ncbi:MAG: nicotinate-nucleotide adenylyltransferase [Phaeovulum sp.]|uniref:nicotinate-nucleotide adenylyltransferase n=1 Tax=Phaeovulum sp. TaxID=2934796 RepID=UPI002730ACA4|nr:nicotinate-nucleotide adenylyltransferase [Phaeovulum sp.]MDP2064328.1 nicotinate-nucleotide adenylyltransferase [Phaeovulum sp.]
MRQGFPIAAPGMAIGLLGGSFDPAHEGHVRLTHEALKRFRLDRVWWLVSPGNPLKAKGPAPLAVRMARAREVMDDPRVLVSDIEARLGTYYTADTLRRLKALYPCVNFVWLMGADNLAQFHLWHDWRGIFGMVPLGVLARPGQRLAAQCGPAARAYAGARIAASAAPLLARAETPAWCYIDMPMLAVSSSAIRARSDWHGAA